MSGRGSYINEGWHLQVEGQVSVAVFLMFEHGRALRGQFENDVSCSGGRGR